MERSSAKSKVDVFQQNQAYGLSKGAQPAVDSKPISGKSTSAKSEKNPGYQKKNLTETVIISFYEMDDVDKEYDYIGATPGLPGHSQSPAAPTLGSKPNQTKKLTFETRPMTHMN